MIHYKVIRYIEFEYLFERFFVAAILSIIGIRLFLKLFGYPQVGGGILHIAHMFWGGLLMLFALLGLMLFLNDGLKPFFAILGGVGFGAFIDEVGKFITHDNNYFFQPTFAIIYVLFVALFLLNRMVNARKKFSQAEYLANSLDKFKEVIISDLDKKEKALALQYLEKSDPTSPIVGFLKKSFTELPDAPEVRLSTYEHAKVWVASYYARLKGTSWFLKGLTLLFVVRSLGYLYSGISLIVGVMTQDSSFWLWFNLIPFLALVAQAVLTALGVWEIRVSRRAAYAHFKNSVLVSILVLQVFNFYRNPVSAFISTLFDLVMLAALNYIIERENVSKTTAGLSEKK